MKACYVTISLIPKKCILSSMKYFRLRSHEGSLCQNFFKARKRILPSIKYFSQEPGEGILC